MALAQMQMSEDIDENLKKSIDFIKKASRNGADLILFPELQLTPFFPQYEDIDAERYVHEIDSPHVREIQNACLENGIFAVTNLYITENGKNYDMSFLIDEKGKIVGNQKMVHIKQAERFYEASYYTPSEEGFNVFKTPFGKIAIVICFDRHLPESIRTATLKGADLILIPTANTSDEPTEMFQWEVKVQSFQNNVTSAMCNRVGLEDEMEFNGNSIICNTDGETLALAGSDEGILYAEVNLQNAKVKEYISFRRENCYF